MSPDHDHWVVLAWVCVSSAFVLFALIAVGLTHRFEAVRKASALNQRHAEVEAEALLGSDSGAAVGINSVVMMDPSVDEFVTARKRASVVNVAWSFYATAVGSWVTVGPPSYAVYAGILGLSMYSLSSGIPLLGIAFFGSRMQSKYPHISSSSEFVGERFGRRAQLLYVVLIMFNMSIAMLAEYTTLASLFRDFVKTLDFPVILIEGFLALFYTAYGGLYVSIITDQFQGICSLLLTAILLIYICRQASVDPTFSGLKNSVMPVELKGLTLAGYSSVFVQPVSLSSSTVFLESMWQKCWASSDKRALYVGSGIGCVLAIIIVFFFGMCGILAAWAGLIDLDSTNPNLYLFQLFKESPTPGSEATLSSWPSLLVLTTAAIMSQSAVDSLQNGMMGTLSSYLLKGKSLWVTRIMVVGINLPLIIIAVAAESSVLQLFLIANMMCTACAVPFFTGAFSLPYNLEYGENNVLFSVSFSIVGTSLYGAIQRYSSDGFLGGIWFAWYGNGYLWDYFFAAFMFSIIGTLASLCYTRFAHAPAAAVQVQVDQVE
eukprot:TRINITY_DN3444_c0_g1_i1.p1 TRINITY_DN3444_c0_g1~~TRINITY_DN3444_c0_g1_i1.p1  ORF type:complete len:566 (-),score=138.06 TRINITY_DN3444_c0_g1_i1:669-2306(-)